MCASLLALAKSMYWHNSPAASVLIGIIFISILYESRAGLRLTGLCLNNTGRRSISTEPGVKFKPGFRNPSNDGLLRFLFLVF